MEEVTIHVDRPLPGVQVTTEDMIKALKLSGGLLSHAADLLACSYSTISVRAKHDPRLRQIIEECRERHIDDSENSLRSLVQKQDFSAVCFSLKTIGKKRGYTEHKDPEEMDPKVLLSQAEYFKALANARLANQVGSSPSAPTESSANASDIPSSKQ